MQGPKNSQTGTLKRYENNYNEYQPTKIVFTHFRNNLMRVTWRSSYKLINVYTISNNFNDDNKSLFKQLNVQYNGYKTFYEIAEQDKIFL